MGLTLLYEIYLKDNTLEGHIMSFRRATFHAVFHSRSQYLQRFVRTPHQPLLFQTGFLPQKNSHPAPIYIILNIGPQNKSVGGWVERQSAMTDAVVVKYGQDTRSKYQPLLVGGVVQPLAQHSVRLVKVFHLFICVRIERKASVLGKSDN